jgi:hypothetical protein
MFILDFTYIWKSRVVDSELNNEYIYHMMLKSANWIQLHYVLHCALSQFCYESRNK